MRRWEFYFAYCEAAFDSRYLQDYQIVWQRSEDCTQHHQAFWRSALSANRPKLWDRGDSDAVNNPAQAPQLSSDLITMALFAVYCILGGVVVARQPRMLLALITFILGQASLKVRWKVHNFCAVAQQFRWYPLDHFQPCALDSSLCKFQVSKQMLPVLFPEFENLSVCSQGAWIVDMACAVWSILLGLPALGVLLSSNSWTSALQPRDAAPALLVRPL